MIYAVKANRQYPIGEDEKQKFIDLGYKIAELKDDKLVFQEVETEESKEITKLETENEKLRAELKKLEDENKALQEPKQGKTKGEGK